MCSQIQVNWLIRYKRCKQTPWLALKWNMSLFDVGVEPWSNESASHRKLTCDDCDDTSQTAAQVVTSSALSLYSLTFLRWHISYDSPLKRCLKDTFLLPLLTWVFPSLTISFLLFSIWSWPVWLLSLWVLLWFKTTSASSEAAMVNFETKDFHRLVFCFRTTRRSSPVERNLRWNLNKLKLVAS